MDEQRIERAVGFLAGAEHAEQARVMLECAKRCQGNGPEAERLVVRAIGELCMSFEASAKLARNLAAQCSSCATMDLIGGLQEARGRIVCMLEKERIVWKDDLPSEAARIGAKRALRQAVAILDECLGRVAG